MKDLMLDDDKIYSNLKPKERIVIDQQKDGIENKLSIKILDQFKNQERISNNDNSLSPDKRVQA